MQGTYGELIPLGGGDPIPLLKPSLLVGRLESSDIVLRFPNVSGRHCELNLIDGRWFVKDLGSSNGTKVNGVRASESRIEPGDTLSIAKHEFEVAYEPIRTGAGDEPPNRAGADAIFARSLLESAGLEKSRRPEPRADATASRGDAVEWPADEAGPRKHP